MAIQNAKLLDKNIELELVVVNDSPWTEIPKELLLDDSYKLVIVTNEKNYGIQGARIAGLKASTGYYVMLLDQDDEIEDSCISKHLATIGDSDVSVSNGYRFDGNKRHKIYPNLKQQRKVKSLFWYIYLENRILSPGQCLIRKSSIPDLWCSQIMKKNGADDMFLWVMMLKKGCKFSTLPHELYIHNSTGENVSGDEELMAESTYEMLDILVKNECIDRFYSFLLKRKIDNDVSIIRYGKNKFLDYRIIEKLRKYVGGT